MDIKDAMWLDHALSVCRKFAEKDLGVRVSNTQSIKHIINEFTKMVESRKMTFKYWWDVRQAFDIWFEKATEGLVSDEEILIEMYKFGELNDPPNETPTTKEERDCCDHWRNWISWRIRKVLHDYGTDLDKMFTS